MRWRPGVSSVNRDTEMFAEFIARDGPRTFLDVGTGTGYVAIRLALGGSEVHATDVSSIAKELAERNAGRNGVSLSVRISDLFENVEGTYDGIAFNPPFSARPDRRLIAVVKQIIRRIGPLERALMRHMPRDVALFRRALIERFLEESLPHLAEDGALYLLLYSHEIPYLDEVAHRLSITTHSPPALKRRNLCFVRISRRPGGSGGGAVTLR
jgi:methylase of polypeptide subunit release factors